MNAVKTRSGSTAEDSQNETGSESDDSEQCNYTSRVRTKLRIQNDADVIHDITDLGWNRRQKLKLRHIADPQDGEIQELEALIRTKNVPVTQTSDRNSPRAINQEECVYTF